MTNQVIKGSLEECLRHFSREHGTLLTRNRHYARRAVVALFGINGAAGHRWFDQNILPVGVNRCKLWYFLELIGYRITDPVLPHREQADLLVQLALSVVTPKMVATRLSIDSNTVLRWLNGDSVPMEENRDKLKAILYENKLKTEEKKIVWVNVLRDLDLPLFGAITDGGQTIDVRGIPVGSSKPEPRSEPKTTLSAVSVAGRSVRDGWHGQEIEILAHLLLAAKPLADRILSDEFSAEDRRKLRELTATNGRSNGVFDLSNSLNRLCGERARHELHQPQATRKDAPNAHAPVNV